MSEKCRFTIVEQSESGHGCCFGATVIDNDTVDPVYNRPKRICECLSVEDATIIVDALIKRYENE